MVVGEEEEKQVTFELLGCCFAFKVGVHSVSTKFKVEAGGRRASIPTTYQYVFLEVAFAGTYTVSHLIACCQA